MEQNNEHFGFCTSCGTKLTGGAFCSNCGAKVAVAAPVAAPVTEPVAAPVTEPAYAAEPVAAAPAQQAAFPLVPVILVGVAALYTFIMMCVDWSFLSFLEVSAMAAIIVGMIVFRKDKNLVTAIGFLALAGIGFIGTFLSFANTVAWRPGLAIFSFLFGTVAWAANGGIGISYLLAKPKLANLKTLSAAVGAGIAFLTLFTLSFATRSFGWQLLNFLFGTLPLCAGALLYTPFKK